MASGKIDKIGIQTYTLREMFEPDPAGTLAMLKAIGYDYVELNERNFTTRSADELAGLIADAGLYSPATHVSYAPVRDTPETVIANCKTLGCEYAIIPWVDADQRELGDYKRHAALFNERGKMFRDAGIQLGYHNHQFEFDDLGGGTRGQDILLSETDPENLVFELDMFWAALNSVDIPALFVRYPGRFELCHIKDMKGDPANFADSRDYGAIGKALMVNVGEGELPFAEWFAMNDLSGMKMFITEHDNPPKPYRKSVETSYNTVKNLRF